MKRIFLITILFAYSYTALFNQEIKHYGNLNKEDNIKHKQYLRFLQDKMYHTEDGVNNRVIEDELKRYFRESRNLKNKSLSLLSSNFADGRLTGNWYERGSNNNAGRTHQAELAKDMKTVFIGSSGGNIWKGTIEGNSWTCLNNTYKFNDIKDIKLVDYNNNERLIVTENKAVYFTDDQGNYWGKSKGLESVENWGSLLRAMTIKNGNKLRIYTLTQEWNYQKNYQIRKLYFSDNYGESFKEIFNFDYNNSIDIWGNREYNKLFVQLKDTLYQLDTNNNLTFLAQSPFIQSLLDDNNDIIMTGSIINATPIIYYATKYQNSNRMILKYNDAKKEIAYMGEVETDMFMSNSFQVSKINPNLIWIGGVNCYYSTDGGLGWNMINSWTEYYKDVKNKLHADIPGINTFKIDNSSEYIFINTDGGTYLSKDNPSVYQNISLSGLNVSQYYSTYTYDGPLGQYVYAGAQDQGFQIGDISGNNTAELSQDISGDYGAIVSADGGTNVWSVYPGYLLYYTNLPLNKFSLGWNFEGRYEDRVWMPALAAIPGEPKKVVIAPGTANNTSKLIIVSYNGNKLVADELPFQFDTEDPYNDVSAIGISSVDTKLWYVATKQGNFYTSNDAGNTWTLTPNFKAPGYNYLHPTPIVTSNSNRNIVYVGGAGYNSPGVYVSKDAGKTFEALGENMPKAFFYDFDLNNDESAIFAATSVGPYIYIFGSNKWYPIIDNNTPDQIFWSVNYIPSTKTARFATYGRGIWDFKIDNLITNVETHQSPITNTMVDIYPNPAHDFVNIDLSKVNGKINSSRIFDIDGNLVLDLTNKITTNNQSLFKWDLNNDLGYKVRSGSYVLVSIINGLNYYSKINVIE